MEKQGDETACEVSHGKPIGQGVGCPMDAILRLLMGPWTTYILWVLLNEPPLRFTALKRAIPGISAKVLTERLRMLETQNVVSRAYQSTIPPTVTYTLTQKGRDLESALRAINELALQWRAQDEALEVAPRGDEPCAGSVDRIGRLC
jgi:DNA-binding HxlR family transcriptional regulator